MLRLTGNADDAHENRRLAILAGAFVQGSSGLLAVDDLRVHQPQHLVAPPTSLFSRIAHDSDAVVVVPEKLWFGVECLLHVEIDLRVAEEAADVPGEEADARALVHPGDLVNGDRDNPRLDVSPLVEALKNAAQC